MRILFDTNVILDALLERLPFVKEASWLLARVERGEVVGFLGATTVTTVYYFTKKSYDSGRARTQIRRLLRLFEVAPVGRGVLEGALDDGFEDYEDGVLHEAGQRAGVEAVVTRNPGDYERAELPVYTPEQLRALIEG